MKLCPRCSTTLPPESFHKSAKSKDGLQGYCKTCVRGLDKSRRESGYFKDHRAKNADSIRATRSRWKEQNKEKLEASNKRYREENLEKVSSARDKYRRENPEKVLQASRNYQRKNKHKYAMYASKRRFAARQAQPSWLSPEDKKRMELFWGLAELKSFVTGVEYEVDHIVPLQGKTVCGLHVPWNLRVIPREENRRKQNKFWPDMWEGF